MSVLGGGRAPAGMLLIGRHAGEVGGGVQRRGRSIVCKARCAAVTVTIIHIHVSLMRRYGAYSCSLYSCTYDFKNVTAASV